MYEAMEVLDVTVQAEGIGLDGSGSRSIN